MQESKRRKIYQCKNPNNTYSTEASNMAPIKKSNDRTYRKKSRSKHSKRNKKWHSISHANLKHANCSSNYFGPERLTKHVGFLTKGKISDSISRLERIMPDDLRARANQDLHGILKFVNKSQSNVVQSNLSSQIDACQSSYSPNYISPLKDFAKNVIKEQSEALNLKKIRTSALSSNVLSDKRQYILYKDELAASVETITNRLHVAVGHSNKQMFPGVSNQEILKNEILSIKRFYNNRKTFSNSSNCESSQEDRKIEVISDDNFELNPVLTEEPCTTNNFKDNFELKPILTQESNIPKDLVNMFPNIQVTSSSSEEDFENSFSPSAKESEALDFMEQASPNFDKKSISLIAHSPSSNGTPVWVPLVSPMKFVPDFLPTPKIYFRQKMF